MPGHLGAVSLKKSHDIIILSFCNIVKGQANNMWMVPKVAVHILRKHIFRDF